MSSFWKNASIMSVAELFLKLKALVMMPFITKYLGTMNYGIWSQVMVIVSLLSPLVFCGMDNSLTRFLPGQPIEQQRHDFTGWLLFGVITSVILLWFVYIVGNRFSELFFGIEKEYSLFVTLAGLNIVTTSLLTGIRNWFRVQNNAWTLVSITIIQNLLQMMVLIWVLVEHQGIYELVLWSLVVDSILIVVYIAFMVKAKVFLSPSLKWLKPYFKFGIVFLPSGYAVWILNSLDRIFLARYHSLSDIGVYSICFTVGYTLIQIIVNPIWSLFPTKAAELYNVNNFKELNKLFNQSIKLICWIIFPSIFGLVLVGESLMKFISTDEFASGYLAIPIILSGYLFFMLSSYFESILIWKNKPYLSTAFTVLACIMNIIFNFILIPKFSYMGAAIATMLSFAVQLSISCFYALKEGIIELDKDPIIKIFMSSIGMFFGTYFIKICWLSFDKMWSFLLLIFLGIFFYVVLTIYILKIYNFKCFITNFNKELLDV